MAPLTRSNVLRERYKLVDLPDELMEQCAQQLLVGNDPCSVLRLQQTCKDVHAKIARVCVQAEATARLQWLQSANGVVGAEGRRISHANLREMSPSWAYCRPLATAGTSTWTVRVVDSGSDVGYMRIGVCDVALRRGWGFNGCSGQLYREDAPGLAGVFDETALPDGHGTQLMFDGRGRPARWNDSTLPRPRAIGARVEVHVDHDASTLSFRLNGGPRVEALRGLPPLLRPWVMLMQTDDCVQFEGFLSRGGARE